ncbi:hypothetical protein FNH22_17205 [Fulvivirga sp. M361]|uniref:DUF7009 family protein n=1 Tax=Fulvivirga sp. M361 TaxID=2594266 RepID=UPI001179D8F8|nr:hypothetical protein [Fulvivirga sp. M361]TRX56116.1 hypothetical protein FNH22_17205 [Fulvivirga sp. M361]
MKLRIKGNTLRLRLSKTEVDEVSHKGMTSDTISFPTGRLIYTLAGGDDESLNASFKDSEIRIVVPGHVMKEWAITDQVGFSGQISLADGQEMSVLVEKDFQCSMNRPEEDESDLYENPQMRKRRT